ncbi:MAG: hypothetical protein EOP88_07655 [Verrucomicrobiaceae bacterium]|nr:MAG: hypothetical protein EOP88_07655 [Verrucomicrobiaceae bacterium]
MKQRSPDSHSASSAPGMIRVLMMTLPPLIILTVPATITRPEPIKWFLAGCMAGIGLVAAGGLFLSHRSLLHRAITLVFLILNGMCLWGVVTTLTG